MFYYFYSNTGYFITFIIEKELSIREDTEEGAYVKDLTWEIVKTECDMRSLLNRGNRNRENYSKLLNIGFSSKINTIFTIIIECEKENEDGEYKITVGKLNLVDRLFKKS